VFFHAFQQSRLSSKNVVGHRPFCQLTVVVTQRFDNVQMLPIRQHYCVTPDQTTPAEKMKLFAQ
jgi:hypothetical protein